MYIFKTTWITYFDKKHVCEDNIVKVKSSYRPHIFVHKICNSLQYTNIKKYSYFLSDPSLYYDQTHFVYGWKHSTESWIVVIEFESLDKYINIYIFF